MPPGNEVVFEKLPNVVANWLAMLLRMPPAASQRSGLASESPSEAAG